jgi:hypothetical protein
VKVTPPAGANPATPDNGPGAPPGEQPDNATPVPPNANNGAPAPQGQKKHRRHQQTDQ